MLAPTMESTPIKAVTKRRDKRFNGNTNSKNEESVKSDESTQRKKTRLDDEELENHEVDLEKTKKTPLKTKGKRDDSAKKKKKKKDMEKSKSPGEEGKKATFAETVGKETVEENAGDYKKCVVGFAVRADKGNNTKRRFDKKIIKGLSFMQICINRNMSFHPIRLDETLNPIKEKGDMPKYQVMVRKYFSIPNQRAFDNLGQDRRRVIKGLVVMGFTHDSQRCLNNAAGDLRMMGCTIFYKKCQEVDRVATQMLVEAPNTIEATLKPFAYPDTQLEKCT
jgi:hypothetical protein